ncbi:MAG: L-threonylcarbamoyladenylate synthase [Gammaproteobacteria bacterium]
MRRSISDEDLQKVLKLLKNDGLVVLPTETVYGLAADAARPKAIAKVFDVKGRESSHSLTIHIHESAKLETFAKNIPDYARTLASHFWPGPMTLILPKQPGISETITGNSETVGLRMPNNPIVQEVLSHFPQGLVMPSANRTGHFSPTSVEHVKLDLGDRVDFIMDGGIASMGLESTIIDCTTEQPKILRIGTILPEEIETVIGLPVAVTSNDPAKFASRIPIHVLSESDMADYIEQHADQHITVLSRRLPPMFARHVHWHVMPNDSHAYRHTFYEQLHRFEQQHSDCILVEEVPDTPEWLAIRERLRRL